MLLGLRFLNLGRSCGGLRRVEQAIVIQDHEAGDVSLAVEFRRGPAAPSVTRGVHLSDQEIVLSRVSIALLGASYPVASSADQAREGAGPGARRSLSRPSAVRRVEGQA
jgi:hypothetical protein